MRMMGRVFKAGVCCCPDCSGPCVVGRAGEKRAWVRQVWAEAAEREGHGD